MRSVSDRRKMAEVVGLPLAIPRCAARYLRRLAKLAPAFEPDASQGFSSHLWHGIGEDFTYDAVCFRSTENGGGGGIRTHGWLPNFGFQDRRNRPLCHPSGLSAHGDRRGGEGFSSKTLVGFQRSGKGPSRKRKYCSRRISSSGSKLMARFESESACLRSPLAKWISARVSR